MRFEHLDALAGARVDRAAVVTHRAHGRLQLGVAVEQVPRHQVVDADVVAPRDVGEGLARHDQVLDGFEALAGAARAIGLGLVGRRLDLDLAGVVGRDGGRVGHGLGRGRLRFFARPQQHRGRDCAADHDRAADREHRGRDGAAARDATAGGDELAHQSTRIVGARRRRRRQPSPRVAQLGAAQQQARGPIGGVPLLGVALQPRLRVAPAAMRP
ncbi:MAG: hypothetical protein U0168_16400 [Nannocystaceae bacterium]